MTQDDRRFESLTSELRDLQFPLVGCCLNLPLVAAGPCVLSRFAARVARRIAEPTRLDIQLCV